MSKIKLSPSELKSQSLEMKSLMGEYEILFTNVTTVLKETNNNWSPLLSHNFSGKIDSAQNSFSAITEMLQFGSSAALNSAETFENIDSSLSKVFGHSGNSSPNITINKSVPAKTSNTEDPNADLVHTLKFLKSLLGSSGKVLDIDECSFIGDRIGTLLATYSTCKDIMTQTITQDTYTKLIKELLDLFGEFDGGERLGIWGATIDLFTETYKVLEYGDPATFLQNANDYIESTIDFGKEIGKYWGLVEKGLSNQLVLQKALTNITTIATMGTKLAGDVLAFSNDGIFDLQDFSTTCMDIGAYGGSSLVKGLTFGLLNIDPDGAIETYSSFATGWSDFLYDTGLPLELQYTGAIVGAPVVAAASTLQIVYDTLLPPFQVLENGTNWVLENVSSKLSTLFD